ncbi:FAD-binding oxidoreductase [Mesorhizobium sp. IMUNJ 23232]|uniref:FAD-binding oxidoreductase n=1 Tax=Mesorhizobium sp. IMUNJ 23232 TaxID=3376064 RepID=UPI0037B5E1BF
MPNRKPRDEACREALTILRRKLPETCIVEEAGDMRRYEIGARYGDGSAAFVLRPSTVEELRSSISICSQCGVRIVPQGANTGLVGASTPSEDGDQVVLSLERLKQPLVVDADNRSVTVGAGVRLSELNAALEAHGLFFPIDLGADPSVGGMVATNTGGSRFIRYGDVRANVIGLEVVLADSDATVLDLATAVRKNNIGPDLKQLFVGTGGAFGIVTKAVLNVMPKPAQQVTALLALSGPESIAKLVPALEGRFGELLTAVEAMSAAAVNLALVHRPSLKPPFAPEPMPDETVLVELSTSLLPGALNLDAVLEAGLADLFEEGMITNALVGRAEEFWLLRHALSEGLKAAGKVVAFDISVPRGAVGTFKRDATALVGNLLPDAVVADFGHVGDGGLHFNLVLPATMLDISPVRVQEARQAIYELVHRQGGSFSAEHGVGPYNWTYYEQFRGPLARSIDGRLADIFGRILGRLSFKG